MKALTLRRIWLVFAPAAAALVLAAAYGWPEQAVAWVERLSPGCFFHRLTGLSCPGCGGTRALQAFLQGDWAAAWRYNMFLWVSLLVLAGEYLRMARAELHGSERISSSRVYSSLLSLYAIATILWFVLRNILHV